YMVWNRKARKGAGRNRANPVEEWIWSPMPTHDVIIDLDTWLLAQDVPAHRQGSRSAAGKDRRPTTNRIYRLRSYITCASCGRRMFGNHMTGITYYACTPKQAWRPPGHPAALRLREDELLDSLNDFLNKQVFGQYRGAIVDVTR